MDKVTELSTEQMRQAIAAGAFPRALLLWNEYVPRFAEALKRGELTLGQWRETGEFVEWARLAALGARAYAQDRLQSLHVTGQYSQVDPPTRPHLVQTSI
jgi:hypothetical protein